jgi:hypothetical protein
MADETNETGAQVSAPTTGACLIVSLDEILRDMSNAPAEKVLTMAVKLHNQAEQLRRQQRALVRRAKTIKRQRALIYYLDRVVEAARDYYSAHSDEYDSRDLELAMDILADLRPPRSTKEATNAG